MMKTWFYQFPVLKAFERMMRLVQAETYNNSDDFEQAQPVFQLQKQDQH
jgi:hypothetical protein